MRELKAAIAEKRDTKIMEVLERMENRYDGLQELSRQERNELKQILTPEQQGRSVIFQIDLTKEVRRMYAEARRKDR